MKFTKEETENDISKLAFITGQLLGMLTRKDIQEYLEAKGFSDGGNLVDCLKSLSNIYYKD